MAGSARNASDLLRVGFELVNAWLLSAKEPFIIDKFYLIPTLKLYELS